MLPPRTFFKSEHLLSNPAERWELGAGDGWIYTLEPGETLRVIDLKGNEGTDITFYDADNPADHYSAIRSVTVQKNVYLKAGSILRTESGAPLLEITGDTCGCHDTLGGCCSAQSNTVRYAHEKLYMHNCRDTFFRLMAGELSGYEKRDLAPNVNLFTNVPVQNGTLEFDEGFSPAGGYIDLQALRRVKVLISNCPQLNNPCCGYNPTPIGIEIYPVQEES